MKEQAQDHVDTKTIFLLAFSATSGVLVEFYDFFIFGYAAASAFPHTFFPNLSPTAALVVSYVTFGAGFPARLLGAFLFGHFGDRLGRKSSFLLNILIVGATTILVGLLPGYDTIGVAAPILLILLRVIQGIGLGGEFGGASSLLAEFGAKRKHRAFWVSLANIGIPGGAMAASAVLYFLSDSFATGGWRIAMLLSAVVVIPGLLARSRLGDSPLFETLKEKEELSKMPSIDVMRQHWRPIVLLALVCGFQQMDGYVSGTYAISFMKSAGIPLATTAVIIFVARIGDVLGVLVSGPAADFMKRKQVTFLAIAITAALSYPYTLAILHKQVELTLVLQFLITLTGVGVLHGLAPILTSEAFPTKYRYSGAGISYSLSAIFGGMCAPPLLAGLIGENVAEKWFYVPVVYGLYALVAFVALYFIPESRDLALDDLDAARASEPTSSGATAAGTWAEPINPAEARSR
ncbi:MHS family MFS transporter [Methylobacterium sp. C25]|uniref:MFS transporter n=1 Tax=Methylobacterium sp. C25 TaxID=2721622 RepID=UPI001F4452E8|nr:MFS transporter [Methylobacterium sp. C25]MCE4226113.1 MHS family MFS transporter [Methylobacterium sp. C25]